MSPVSKRRILIIDDQSAIHDDYRKIISPRRREAQALNDVEAELFGGQVIEAPEERDWYEIDSAFQGSDAVEMVAAAVKEGLPYAVAFVDIRMPPGWDGVQTVRRIWEVDPEVLVVLCSAYSDYSWEDIVKELGRTDRFLFLRKPFESVEVRQCAAALSERWVVSRTDLLTGLLNRRSFEEHLRHEWAFQLHEGSPLSCVFLDIDYFKTINDRFGHASGDDALKLLAALIQEHLRPGDVVCRYGGEEICVLMPNVNEEEACRWAEEMRSAIADNTFVLDGQPTRITASFGVSTRSPAMFDSGELIKLADEALREAKQRGRNRIVGCTELSQVRFDDNPLHRYSSLFESLSADDIMTDTAVCLNEDIVVADAVDTLLGFQLASAPVVDADGILVGEVSEKDILDGLGCVGGWDAPLKNIATKRVIFYERTTSASVIFQFLCRVQVRRVLIVEDGRPVGIVTRSSFLRWVQNYLGESHLPVVDARPQLKRTAEALARRACQLQVELEGDSHEVFNPVVTNVSAMQTLMYELLSWARCSQVTGGSEQLAGVYE